MKWLKKIWIRSWLNFWTHNCKNHQKKLIPEKNAGFESMCTRCGEPC